MQTRHLMSHHARTRGRHAPADMPPDASVPNRAYSGVTGTWTHTRTADPAAHAGRCSSITSGATGGEK